MKRHWWIERTHNAAGDGGAGGQGAGGGAGGAAGAAGDGGGAPTNPYTGQTHAPGAGGQPGQGQPGQGQQGQSQQGQQGQSQQGAPAAYYPDKLPEHLRGASDKDTIDRLWANASGLRDDMAKRGAVPDKADGYKLTLSDDLMKVYGDPSKDKSTKIFQTLAHKHKLTETQAAGLYADWHQELIAQDVYKPLDVTAEAKKMVGDGAAVLSPDQLKERAGAIWTEAMTMVDGLLEQKKLTPAEAVMARALGESADGISLLRAFGRLSREQGLQPGGQGGPVQMTREELDRRNNDPRANPLSQQYDPAFAAQTEAMFRARYGTGQRAA